MKTLNLLAFDLGASNGRGILGRFDGQRITMEELHRFDNSYVERNDLLYWDAKMLLSKLKETFKLYYSKEKSDLACFGIDSWGVDYGLIDRNGRLLGDPRCYRNGADKDMEKVWKIVSKHDLFKSTGIAAMNFNTVYQLYRRKLENDPELEKADAMLMMPDLLGYLLTGESKSEYSNATTTQLYSPILKDWDFEIIDKLGLPRRIFRPVQPSASLRGTLSSAVQSELGVGAVPFAAVGSHDTASAVCAIPGKGNFAFCSSGTWSLFGVETDQPILSEAVFESGFSNEGTVQGGFRPLKNIMGLWLIQECRKDWIKAGKNYGWNDIVEEAKAARPLRSIIDPDDGSFFGVGDMQGRIRDYCRRSAQPVPETVGEIARCIYESLALKYRWALERLSEIKGARIDMLNIVGGGCKNKLLNQMAADSSGINVVTGPEEGAAIGNLLTQAIALGELSGVEELREVVRASLPVEEYTPKHTAQWDDAYGKLLELMK